MYTYAHTQTYPFHICSQNGPGILTRDTAALSWQSIEKDNVLRERIVQAYQDPELRSERVKILLEVSKLNINATSSSQCQDSEHVNCHLEVLSSRPTLNFIELRRNGQAILSSTTGVTIWSTLNVSEVTKLVCNVAGTSLWNPVTVNSFASLKYLNLNYAGLSSLPSLIGKFQLLEELSVVANNIRLLPPELGRLRRLRRLAADKNEISLLPGELRFCTAMEDLSLEDNRLTSVLVNFGSFRRLRTLLLSGNPLEFLPEIGPCESLRSLSVANLRVTADHDFKSYDVVLSPLTSTSGTISIGLFENKSADKLQPIFSLMLRRSSGHHPLLAGSLRFLAEDPQSRELMARQEGALQQLVLMALNDNPIVVSETCKLLALLANHSPALATAIMNVDVSSIVGLLSSSDPMIQRSGLDLVAAISSNSEKASMKLLNDRNFLRILVTHASNIHGEEVVRVASLTALGNLAFSKAGRTAIRSFNGAVQLIEYLSRTKIVHDNSSTTIVPVRVRAAAIRALSILGKIDEVALAVGRPSPKQRGLRILSMDGGGMKGMATVRLLKALEDRTGRPIHSLFDLVVGTSTGGLLTVAVALQKFSMDECEAIYKVLGRKVFARPASSSETKESWMELFYRTLQSKTEHVRAVVVGHKHDAVVYESLLKHYCSFRDNPKCLSDTLIDTSSLDVPKVALVSTLASTSPAIPFVFRNYEVHGEDIGESHFQHEGSSKHEIWQAVRASSAAVYYLDDFTCGQDKFQDGAVTANNPSLIAVEEARALWPHTPIDVIISLGTGSTPQRKRERGISGFIDAGSILIESATSVSRSHEALSTFAPLVPGLKYFRFDPIDARCAMELDEIDPEKWRALDDAVDDYIVKESRKFDVAAACLTHDGDPIMGSVGVDEIMKPAPRHSGKGLLIITNTSEGAEWMRLPMIPCSDLPFCLLNMDLDAANQTYGVEIGDGVVEAEPEALRLDMDSSCQEAAISPALGDDKVVNTSKREYLKQVTPTTPSNIQRAESKTATVEVDLGSTLSSVFNWFSPSRNEISEQVDVNPKEDKKILKSEDESAKEGHPVSELVGDLCDPRSLSMPPEAPKWETSKTNGRSRHPRTATAASKLYETIKEHHDDFQTLHLCLQACKSGLVLRWQETFLAINYPSEESSGVVRAAGYDPKLVPLPALLEMQDGQISLGDSTIFLVNSQYHKKRNLAGLNRLETVLLLRKLAPLEVLDGDCIKKMGKSLSGKILVCSDVLPTACLESLLDIGVQSVIYPSESLATVATKVQAAFLKVLHSKIHQNMDCEDALQLAEISVPVLKGIFKVRNLQ